MPEFASDSRIQINSDPFVLPKGIHWLFFDLDGTLWDHVGASQAALRAACRNFGIPEEEFLPLFEEANRRAWKLLTEGLTTRERLRVDRFSEALSALVAPSCRAADPDAVSWFYLKQYLKNLSPYVLEGAREVIETARGRNLRVAIPTNGFRDTQIPKVEALGLELMVNFLWTPEEAGCLKPAPEFFRGAMRRANCRPCEVLMVGDSLQDDILPALALGMHAAWFNPLAAAEMAAVEEPEPETKSPEKSGAGSTSASRGGPIAGEEPAAAKTVLVNQIQSLNALTRAIGESRQSLSSKPSSQ